MLLCVWWTYILGPIHTMSIYLCSIWKLYVRLFVGMIHRYDYISVTHRIRNQTEEQLGRRPSTRRLEKQSWKFRSIRWVSVEGDVCCCVTETTVREVIVIFVETS